jgi:5-methyltetrahydropteroyltriglutamate--homocysteine methyltransferase
MLPGDDAGNMTEIGSYLHGLYPRSEALVAATRDVDRGRQPPQVVEAQRDVDRAEIVALQRDAGLDLVSSGFLSWADLFRPLVEACRGLATGPLVRWFDNNTFVRTPVVSGPLELDLDLFGGERTDVGLLPGPYTFSQMATGAGDREALMASLARDLLRPAAEEFVRRGAQLVHLQEPWLAAHGIDDESWPAFAAALGVIGDGLGAQLVVHTYFGDAGPLIGRLSQLPVSAVGVDLTETDVGGLAGPWETGLLLGCVDGRSSLVEDVDLTAALAAKILEATRPPRLLLSSSCDLDLLPRPLADRKVRVLAAATQQLREAIPC